MTDRFCESIRPDFSFLFAGKLVHEERSTFQHIQVLSHKYYGHILILDGVLQTTSRDEYLYHETIAHTPLCALKREPKRILIIGGGDGGALKQVLLHDSVEEVVTVELDEAVPRVSRLFFPFTKSFDDPRASLVICDGADYVCSDEARRKRFDIAILDTSDPDTPAQVLYKKEFYLKLRSCLADDAIIIHQCGTPESMGESLSATAQAVKSVFEVRSVCNVPVLTYGGLESFVVGSAYPVDIPVRAFYGKWYNPEIHTASFVLPEISKKLLG